MSSVLTPPRTTSHAPSARPDHATPPPSLRQCCDALLVAALADAPGAPRRLGRYQRDDELAVRELLALARPDGRVLVLDVSHPAWGDARVLACLSPEEPPSNAALVADMYLDDKHRGPCRPFVPSDLGGGRETEPLCVDAPSEVVSDRLQAVYRIAVFANQRSVGELRWSRIAADRQSSEACLVSLRDVLGELEQYEPARGMTRYAIAACPESVSARRLSSELQRQLASPIVLNRALREAVQQRVAEGLSMSEIALRCGRAKADDAGGGETSWLARRTGQMPEGGHESATPSIHSDTLALIAREGLGVAPCEVEL